MPRVVHFEIGVDDPLRAIAFYQDVFGWKIQKWDGPMEYWLVMTGEKGEMGIDGGIVRRSNPVLQTVNTIDVSDIDQYLDKVVAHGGSIVMPKSEIPEIGLFAYCRDTEGNPFGVLQPTMDMK
ncbi:MAG TPA: VOC family protein [Armatimonadota bacterium]